MIKIIENILQNKKRKWKRSYHSRMHCKWKSWLQLVTWSNKNEQNQPIRTGHNRRKIEIHHKIQNFSLDQYRRRITITKRLKANAAIIFTRILSSSLNKSHSWWMLILHLLHLNFSYLNLIFKIGNIRDVQKPNNSLF